MRHVALIALSAAALGGAKMAEATDYTFLRVVDSSGPFGSFLPPSLNNGGTVAFKAALDDGTVGIYSGGGGAVTTIADTHSGFLSFYPLFNGTINDAGVVGFQGRRATGDGVFVGSGGPVTSIAFGGPPSLNNSGTAAYRQPFGANGAGIYTSSGGSQTAIADTNGPFVSLGIAPAINGTGTVAFYAVTNDVPQLPGIFRGTGGPITTIGESGGQFTFFRDVPSINSSGAVAFIAGLSTGEQGVFVGSGGPTTTIVDSTGPFSSFAVGGVTLNDSGSVAFWASLDDGGTGIFTGGDPVADRVIQTGDPLDGSTVMGLMFFRGLNNSGQESFAASLADGRTGIYLATPVPEPASVALTLAAVGGTLAGRRLRTRIARLFD